ncbi:MAG: transcriptional repressor [Candidatus Marinimicrobia bacterium]|jgi:Fur family ferric uptake transcriptional regulator|nr:transcriptional repressor [Candidatus Neomarinimicrobiota bacterium]MBP00101.1 transcriptional repressor [Candidatus Neomarinimicrobiota bacterium]MEC7622321.1 transcriptional repressor [Candidatus Neomarinimicrobiota bacterium]MEC7901492.1 transcriptional repressor [Candidatus Neomarinimicrobiota bacterium]|tara:strand:- start:222 stop:644 length:423 start_codon:yes stop_codon:yes gene_type:complete
MATKNLLSSALKKEGLRHTIQRQAVWDEIKSNDEHRDAEQIYSALRKNNLNVSRATVYRTIDVLYKNNLIRKIELGDSPSKYENKVNSDHHDHIICVQCGRIDEFVDDKIESQQDKIIDKLGFKMIRHIHQLFVLCKDCQ